MESRNKLAMCRLCLCENEYFINVFELNCGHGYIAADVISDLLQFQVSETDGYPHVVCSKCLVKLTDFKLFKECCLKSKVKYDNMLVSRESPEERQPEMREFVTVKAEPVFYLPIEANISKDEVIESRTSDYSSATVNPTPSNDEVIPSVLITSGKIVKVESSEDEVTEPQTSEHSSASVNPTPSNDEVIPSVLMTSGITVKVKPLEVEESESQESDSFFQAVVGISTNANEISADFESGSAYKEEPLLVQVTDSDSHPHDLLCLEHFSPNASPKGAHGESAFERSKNISLSVELEASTSETMECLEGQQISPREMYMNTSIQFNFGIGKEEESWSEGEAGGEGTSGTPQMGNQVVGVLEANVSCREIARHVGVAPSTVTRIKRRWETEHSVEESDGQERPRSTTVDKDVKLLEFVGENPFTSSTQARIETNFQASTRMLRPRIKPANPQPKRAVIKDVLAPAHRAARLAFARAHRRKGEEFWSRVIFSDKQRFFSASYGPVLVYRPPSTRYDANYIHEQTRSGRFSVKTWAWICADSPGVCCRVDGPLNGEKYVQILDNVMLPSVTSLFADDFIYQQDNSRVHSCMMARRWFEEKQIIQLVWPSWSPDLNPVENIWAFIAREINNKNVRAENPEELWRQIQVEWNSITPEFCRNVVNSMPRRLELVIKNRGELIDYEIMI